MTTDLPSDRPSPGESDSEVEELPRRMGLVLGMGALVFIVDLTSKIIVVAMLSDRAPLRLLGGLVYVTEARNTGAAFGLAQGMTVILTVIAVGVVLVILRTAPRLRSQGWALALGLVLGGALGNLVDRIFRAPGVLRGGVVDFISVLDPVGRVWPIFNVADSAIVCGGLLGIVLALRGVEFDGTRSRRGS